MASPSSAAAGGPGSRASAPAGASRPGPAAPGSSDATAPDGSVVRDPRRFLVLAICCCSLFIVGLDNTAMNVALPSLRADLGASTSELQWTVSAYTLVLASLLMLSGSTADRVGRARLFKVGLTLFTLGSLLCSVAPNVHLLIVFRMLQAIGGSMLNPVAMSIIRNTFEDPRERAQAIGIWAGVIGLSMALGPVVGGGLVEGVSWRAIFWINVPVGIAAVVLTQRFVPESKAPHARRIDPVGQVLVIVLLASLVYAIIEAPDAGWTSAQTIGLLVLAVAASVGLVAYERRRREPLLDPRFFRSAPFAGASLMAILVFAALGAFLFLNTIYLQSGRGLSPLHAGLYTLPMAAMTVVVGPVAGRVVGRFGARPALALGGAAILVSALMLTSLRADTPVAWLFASYVLFGIRS
jgi:EmrB/QacA subfamily drug resistance transporter